MSCGFGCEKVCAQYRAQSDDYKGIMMEAIAARLAAAERTAALQTRLGEQLLSQGRELLAAGEAELGAARRAREKLTFFRR